MLHISKGGGVLQAGYTRLGCTAVLACTRAAHSRSVVAGVLLKASTCQQKPDGISGPYLCCTVEGSVAPDAVVLPHVSTCTRDTHPKRSRV